MTAGSQQVIENRPPLPWSSNAAKTLGESKYGKQSQSIEPRTLTSAAVRMLPMTP